MRRILYSNFESSHDIVEDLLKKMQPKKQSKVLTLFYAWRDIVGIKLSEMSKPVGLSKEKTLIVACKNSMISQELYLSKPRILKSIKYYAENLQVQVEDVCFSHKIWGKYNNLDEAE